MTPALSSMIAAVLASLSTAALRASQITAGKVVMFFLLSWCVGCMCVSVSLSLAAKSAPNSERQNLTAGTFVSPISRRRVPELVPLPLQVLPREWAWASPLVGFRNFALSRLSTLRRQAAHAQGGSLERL